MLLAETVTLVDFLNANWGSILTAMAAAGAALSGAAAWLTRVVWTRIEDYWERRDKREEHTAAKGDTLIDTLTLHAPQQTHLLKEIAATQSALASDIADSRKRDSDVVREIHRGQDAAGELSFALEEMCRSDPAISPHVERYTRRARQKLGLDTPKKKDDEQP